MFRWLLWFLPVGIIVSQDDGLPPNFVYLEPIVDFFAYDPIPLDIIITDRNEIDRVSIFYRFNNETEFIKLEMQVSTQPVIFEVEIPPDEVEAGFIQYYFWARDEFGNEATWPRGGEDLPMVLPIYRTQQKTAEDIVQKEISKAVEGFQPPEKLENNLPYYLEVEILSPAYEVQYAEGVPIIVLSVLDGEQIVNQETVKLLVDGNIVLSFNSPDMITYVPLEAFEAGYHIIRYESNNLTGEILIKEMVFFIHPEMTEESVIAEITWKEKINFKGDLGWNTDYDPFGNPIDVHKINSSAKFQLGNYKFNLSGLMSTNIYDVAAREEAKYRQPSERIKFKMKSPYIDLDYGDTSPEFSELSLKGTRVRGINIKLKRGSWETSFVSGETKHWIDSEMAEDLINVWNPGSLYFQGDQVYDNGIAWIALTENIGSEPCDYSAVSDTCADNSGWIELVDSEYFEIPNDICTAVEPALYGLNPDPDRMLGPDESIVDCGEDNVCPPDINQPHSERDLYEGGLTFIWNGSYCEDVIIYSSKNMITGEDGIKQNQLFATYDECIANCNVPIQFQKGSPIRQLQGFRTSKDFFEHAKFGISAIRSWDVRDVGLVPYLTLDEYTYEGNIAVAGDFMFHFNHDKTILSGEYGISITIDQSNSDTLLLKTINSIDDTLSLYNHLEWDGVDYCYQNQCIDINGDLDITNNPEFVEGAINDSLLWEDVTDSKEKLKNMDKMLGFSINDDLLTGYESGRGVSGLTPGEMDKFINGNIWERINLLMKRPAVKLSLKTPVPLYFTELNFQTELSQAPINYLSHGSSSVQTDVRNWKNKLGFKLLKNQLNFSFGYDNQIKSPWNPAHTDEISEIKRAVTDTYSGSVGLSFRNLPGLNYSIRLQNRVDLSVGNDDGVLSDSTTGLKKMATHTIAPTYKIVLGEININLNGNITLVNDLDLLSDTTGCYTILNSEKAFEMGGVQYDSTKCESNDYYFTKENNPLNDSGNLTTTYTGAISFSFPSPLSLNLGWGMSINAPNDIRQSETVITVLSTKLGYKFFENKLNVTLGGNYVLGFKGVNGFWDDGEVLIIDRNGVWNPGEEFDDDIIDNGKYDEGEIYFDDIANNIYDYLNPDQHEDWIDCNDDLSICEVNDDWDNDTMGNGYWNDGETWTDEGANGTYDPKDKFTDTIDLDNWKLTLKSGIQYKIPEQNITFGLNLDYSLSGDNKENQYVPPSFKAKMSIKYGF